MVEVWVPILTGIVTLVIGGFVGYLVHVGKSQVPTKDNQDNMYEARRAEVLDHMRWAMERMVSEDQAQRRLGASQLAAISGNEYLEPDDKRRIRAATRAALAPRLAPWETERVLGTEEGEQT